MRSRLDFRANFAWAQRPATPGLISSSSRATVVALTLAGILLGFVRSLKLVFLTFRSSPYLNSGQGIDVQPTCLETTPEFCPIPEVCQLSTKLDTCNRHFILEEGGEIPCLEPFECNWFRCINLTRSQCEAKCNAGPTNFVCLRCECPPIFTSTRLKMPLSHRIASLLTTAPTLSFSLLVGYCTEVPGITTEAQCNVGLTLVRSPLDVLNFVYS